MSASKIPTQSPETGFGMENVTVNSSSTSYDVLSVTTLAIVLIGGDIVVVYESLSMRKVTVKTETGGVC